MRLSLFIKTSLSRPVRCRGVWGPLPLVCFWRGAATGTGTACGTNDVLCFTCAARGGSTGASRCTAYGSRGAVYGSRGAEYGSSGAYAAHSAGGTRTLLKTRGFFAVRGAVGCSRMRPSSSTAVRAVVPSLRFLSVDGGSKRDRSVGVKKRSLIQPILLFFPTTACRWAVNIIRGK